MKRVHVHARVDMAHQAFKRLAIQKHVRGLARQ